MFVSHCIEAASGADAPEAVASVVRRAVADETFLASLAARKADGLADDGTLYRSSALTVLPADVPVGVLAPQHDHRMWAVVGVYAGREHNVLYARTDAGLREKSRVVVGPGEVVVLPADVVHTIANEGPDVLHAVHVYGGDLIGAVRSVWNRDTGAESALDWDALRGRATADPS